MASLKSLKKGVGSGVGSESGSSQIPIPDPHQNITDPQTLENSLPLEKTRWREASGKKYQTGRKQSYYTFPAIHVHFHDRQFFKAKLLFF
jgi:hypothetical protein